MIFCTILYLLAGGYEPVSVYAAPGVNNLEVSDNVVGYLSGNTVKSALLSIIFLAVLTEIKTAGAGIGALIGVVAAFLFFGSQWLIGVAGWLELFLFIGGVMLIAIELYVPGVGFFGIAGMCCILASFFMTLGANSTAINIMVISLVVAIILFLLLLKQLPSSRLWAKLVLKESETTKAGFVSGIDYSEYLGREGIALTLLRPAGVIVIDERQFDVVSEGQYIKAGSQVKVVKVSGSRIVVKSMND